MSKLFTEFKPISTKEWNDKIKLDLKSKPYDKLIWNTIHNFSLKPFYRSEDLKELKYLNSAPGEFPFNRGNSIDYNWLINQRLDASDLKKANLNAIKLIDDGVNSITFFNIKNSNIIDLLIGIDLNKIEINFITKNSSQTVAILKKLDKNNLHKIKGSFYCDSITESLFLNKILTNETFDNLIIAKDIISNKFKNYKLISINAANYCEAGVSATHEIAFAVSTAVEYINILTDKNIKADEIIKLIQFNIGIGSDYFIEIAKIKSLRYIWAKVCQSYGLSEIDSKTTINSNTISYNKTIYDKHVNILRLTTEAMSAILGGTDSLFIDNFDKNLPDNFDFAQRISKNIQIILKEEAYFGKITDPSAGSYYIENILDKLIESAWNLFLEIEDNGGFLKSVENNFIIDLINKIQEQRKANTETRNEIILGTNQYPNLNETIDSAENMIELKNNGKIKTHRKAEEFEKIRLISEKSTHTPKVFIFTDGNKSIRNARAKFATNFFGIAGFNIKENSASENIEDKINEFNKSKADIIVLCSTDDNYLQLANKVLQKINPDKIVIAGYPTEIIKDLNKIKINKFIHSKSNIVNELKEFQNKLIK